MVGKFFAETGLFCDHGDLLKKPDPILEQNKTDINN